ncbi:MAG: T9SS type A sorting domain-containing protein [Ignavibacteria bacterium]|nr:T9SS type A sorting domain-containing protein [Ignavibacteria bacterium]
MRAFIFLGILFFCLITITTYGQNFLPEQTIENFNKDKGLMINPEADMLLREKTMSRDLPWQVSAGQRQNPTIDPRVNNRKKKDISKLNDTKYVPVTAMVDDSIRFSYTYDNNGVRLTELDETRTNNAWGNYLKYTYTYDNNGNWIRYLAEIWKNNAWVNYWRSTFTYDNNGNNLTYLEEIWGDNTWENYWRYTYTYDNNGFRLTYLSEEWGNGWENYWRHTYTYDNNGNQLTELIETPMNSAWVYYLRYTYTYDHNRNLLTRLLGNWVNNAWLSNLRDTYTYDNSGNLLAELTERCINNTWVNYWRYTYTYDNNRNQLNCIYETWSNDTWTNIKKNSYSYDNYGNAIKGEYFQWIDNSWVAAQGGMQLFYNFGIDYIFAVGTNVDVTYKLMITDIMDDKLDAKTYSLSQNYPNPFNPTTVIQYTLPYESNVSVTVYNTLGQVVKAFNEGTKQTGSYNVNFNGEGLSSGIYLYNINAVSVNGKQNFQATKKMILIK